LLFACSVITRGRLSCCGIKLLSQRDPLVVTAGKGAERLLRLLSRCDVRAQAQAGHLNRAGDIARAPGAVGVQLVGAIADSQGSRLGHGGVHISILVVLHATTTQAVPGEHLGAQGDGGGAFLEHGDHNAAGGGLKRKPVPSALRFEKHRRLRGGFAPSGANGLQKATNGRDEAAGSRLLPRAPQAKG
jgi:hypothetical protein